MNSRLIKKILNDRSFCLMLVQGTDSENQAFSSYLLMKENMVENLERDFKQSQVCLDDYGEVIYGEYSDQISDETEQKVINLFKSKFIKP